jgi:hypothetical protein
MHPSSLVEVENYAMPLGAEMAKARLGRHGIAAEVFDGEIASNWLYNNAVGGVRLMVAAGDLEAARAILAEEESVEEADVADEDVISEAVLYCPHCHGKDVEARGNTRPGWFRRLLGIRGTFHCRACGHDWTG